jgi:hypothetical protein
VVQQARGCFSYVFDEVFWFGELFEHTSKGSALP